MASAIVDIILSLLRSGKEYLRDMSKIPLEKIEQTLDITTLVWMLLYGSFPYPTAQQQIEEQLGNIEKTIEENPEEAKQGFTWLYRIGRLYRLIHVQPLWLSDSLNTAIRYLDKRTFDYFHVFSDSFNYRIRTLIPPISASYSLRAYDSASYSTEKYEEAILHKILHLSEKLITYDLMTRTILPVIKRTGMEQISLMDAVEKFTNLLTEIAFTESISITDEVNIPPRGKTILSLSDYLSLTEEGTVFPSQILTLTFTEPVSISDGQIQGYPYPEQPEKTYMQYRLSEVIRLTDLLITAIPVLILISATEYSMATCPTTQRKLVRTSDGTLYCVYMKKLGGYYQIYVKKSVDNGKTWTDETRISTYLGMESYDQRYPCIAVDGQDRLHVVWQGRATGYETRYQVWYNYYDGSWHTPVRISTYSGMEVYDQGFDVCIAVDSQDRIHVVWSGKAAGYAYNQVWYNYFDGSWHTPVRISTYSGMESRSQFYPCIAVDSFDRLHVVWHGKATGYTDYYQIWYNYYDGVWHTPIRISTAPGMESYDQFYPSIAVDILDRMHVVWEGRATGYTDYYKVWYNYYDGSWHTPECLQPTGQNRYPNLRWSRYPESNWVTNRLEYVFTEGIEAPYDIMFHSLPIE
ncbi:MAG: exo-alpha-sialidase [Deltaproteobacteria bacterium]|nr:exo-alpha-sialidase [Deltaproteobacteria bacterium]